MSPSKPSQARSNKRSGGPAVVTGPQASNGATASLVAVVEKRGKFLVAEPFFGVGPRLAVSRDSRYDVGDLVLVSPGVSGRKGQGARAKVMRRLGKPDIARDVIEALMLDRGLHRSFSKAVQSDALSPAAVPASALGRQDMRDLPTFTVDPATARDYDDAISARRLDGDRVRATAAP
jgi:ribonuclease R